MTTEKEVARRAAAAFAAIKQAADDPGSVALFTSHHLEELGSAYWEEHTKTPRPTPKQVLDLLVLRGHWDEGDDDGIRVFDFTLPGGVTDCVLSVEFDDAGKVEGVSMES